MPNIQLVTPEYLTNLKSAPTYTLFFCLTQDDYYAENPYLSKVISKGRKYGFLPKPIRNGYKFNGWQFSDGTGLNSNDEFDGDDDLLVIGQWILNAWKASFNANGGIGTMGSVEVPFTDTYTIPPCSFIRTGYIFNGWLDQLDSSAELIPVGALYESDKDVTFYASWQANTYSVHFDGNEDDGTSKGYMFSGWCINNESFPGVVWNFNKSADSITFTHSRTTTTLSTDLKTWNTLWKGAEASPVKMKVNGVEQIWVYSVTRLNNDQEYVEWRSTVNENDQILVAFDSLVMEDQDFTYDQNNSLSKNLFSKLGYSFTGWSKSSNGVKKYDDQENVTNLTAENNAVINLFAKWNPNNYSVKFNANGATGSMSDQSFTYDVEKALSKNTFEKDGFSFDGWSKTVDGEKEFNDEAVVKNLTSKASESVNLYAVWKALGLDVIYGYYVDKTTDFDALGNLPTLEEMISALPETCYANKLPVELFEGESTETDEYEIALTKAAKVGDVGLPQIDFPKYATVFVLVKASTGYKAQVDQGGGYESFDGVNPMFLEFIIDGAEQLTIGGEVYDIYAFWNHVSNGAPIRVTTK